MTSLSAAPARRGTFANVATLGFGHLLRTAWIALSSLRGTLVAFIIGAAGMVALSAGFSVMMGVAFNMPGSAMPAMPPYAQMALGGATIAMIVGVLVGVSAYAKEHSTGSLRSLYTAAPRRVALLGATAMVLFTAVFLASVLALLLSFAAVAVVYVAFDQPLLSSALGELVFPVLGGAFFAAATAVFALGIGALLRSETWGVTLTLVFMLVVPGVFMMLPYDWATTVHDLLLPVAGGNLSAIHETWDPALLGDIALTAAWPAAALIGGMAVVRSRDA